MSHESKMHAVKLELDRILIRKVSPKSRASPKPPPPRPNPPRPPPAPPSPPRPPPGRGPSEPGGNASSKSGLPQSQSQLTNRYTFAEQSGSLSANARSRTERIESRRHSASPATTRAVIASHHSNQELTRLRNNQNKERTRMIPDRIDCLGRPSAPRRDRADSSRGPSGPNRDRNRPRDPVAAELTVSKAVPSANATHSAGESRIEQRIVAIAAARSRPRRV